MWWARLLNVISGLLSGAGAPASTNSYESIATTTVGSGGSATITFSSIPSTYKHLQIRYIGRNTTAADAPILRFNSDSGSNYARHKLAGDGATVSAAAATTATYMGIGDVPATANSFAAGVIDVLDYQNTSKYKTVRSLTGYDLNGSGSIDFRSNLWQSTSAVTDISIAASSNNFAQYSSFALYGIKG
jgi:hypothetical protein